VSGVTRIVTPALPDIGRLERVPAAIWRELAARLRGAGLGAAFLDAIQDGGLRRYDMSLQRCLLLGRARKRGDAATFAYRVFMLRDPVSEMHAVDLLGGCLLGKLIDAGLLVEPQPGAVVSAFDLRLFRGLLILCDDLLNRGDAVFGVGSGTTAFCGLPTGSRIARALDVGCGAGAVALWLARDAEYVVGADINPRALAFLRINAALNGIRNVEGREGDLFEPVESETFDVITSQPPYVPVADDVARATYLHGGSLGNELLSRLLRDLPERLDPEGRAIIVFEQASRSRATRPDIGSVASLGERMRTLCIIGDEVDTDAYCIRHALPELRRGIEAFDSAATVMREHLARLDVSSVYSAVCVIEHAHGEPGWIEIVQAKDTLWSEISSESIERLRAGHSLLRRPDELKQARVKVPEQSLVVRHWASDDQTDGPTYLGLPPGYLLSSLELSSSEWDALEYSCDHGHLEAPPVELLVKAARWGLIE
jgi:SAM-dependent methyltransferase